MALQQTLHGVPCPAHPRPLTPRRRGTTPRRPFVLFPLLVFLLVCSCQNADPLAKEKERPLTADERYLVAYYIRIVEVEKSLHDNPELQQEKWQKLGREIDKERIARTLTQLEKKPERWLAIYNRINKLQLRALQNPPSEKR